MLTLNGKTVLNDLAETREGCHDAVVGRDLATDSNLALCPHDGEERVKYDTTDVVKVAVNVIILESGLEVCAKGGTLVVDTRVGTKRNDPVALFLAASDADDALGANHLLGELHCDGPDRTDVSLHRNTDVRTQQLH